MPELPVLNLNINFQTLQTRDKITPKIKSVNKHKHKNLAILTAIKTILTNSPINRMVKNVQNILKT